MKIRICTYNCKNYFSTTEADLAKPEKEQKALIKMINRINADILCLQEVQNQSVLEEINQALKLPYDYFLLEQGNSERGINVGIMSHLIFQGQSHKHIELLDAHGKVIQEHQDKQSALQGKLTGARFQRDLYLCEFSIKDKNLLIFNTHYKSRKNYPWLKNDADTLRTAESLMTREIIREYISDQNNLVLLAGDLNQKHKHHSVKTITKWPQLNDPILQELLSVNPGTTTYHAKAKERIDYLLMSDSLYQFYQPGSAKIFGSETAKIASDHLPCSIDLVIN